MIDHPDITADIVAQAAELERMLPALMRRLFALDPGHAAEELPLAQLRVCHILEAGPRHVSSVAEELGISTSAVTQIADRLEKSGLIERLVESDDRRMKPLRLTDRGEDMMQTRREYRIRRASCALRRLSPAAREALTDMVRELLDASETNPSPGGEHAESGATGGRKESI